METAPPSAWQSRRTENCQHIEVEGTRAKYIGPGTKDTDAASIRADHPVPQQEGIYYYEVTIASRGNDGFIGVGYCTADVPSCHLPGWKPHSYGYHGDDGHAFSGSGQGRSYGPTYTTGDVIGACFNRAAGTITYYKNGMCLGVAFDGVREEAMFPSVGMRTKDEEVVARFEPPFVADAEAMKRDAVRHVEAHIASTPLEPEPPDHRRKRPYAFLMEKLVFGYLTHNGFCETAAVMARDALASTVHVSAVDTEGVQLRQEITDGILAGDVDTAMTLTEALAPGTLEASPGLLFKLHIQRFLELIRAGSDMEAIQFGNTILPAVQNTTADTELLKEAVTLLGYSEPLLSPSGHLLKPAHQVELAAELRRAILARKGGMEESPLELAYRQLMAVQQELQSIRDPAASLIDMPKRTALH